MKDQLRRISAHVFERAGTDKLSRSEFINLLSHDLRWFKPEDSKSVLSGALKAGILKLDDERMLTPAFKMEDETTDDGYKPPRDLDLSQLDRPLIERWIETVAGPGMDKRGVVRNVNSIAEEYNLLFPAAALYYGIRSGRDMSRYYNEVHHFILHGER